MSAAGSVRCAIAAHAAGASAFPFVLLSWAQSSDGYISAGAGVQTPISCPETGLLTHRLRDVCDAILVGRGTIATDNPRLNLRLPGKPPAGRPVAVVLDSDATTSPNAAIVTCRADDKVPVYVFCSEEAAERRRGEREELPLFRLLTVPRASESQQAKLCLRGVLAELRRRDILSVMVEGGSEVLNSFLEEGLCDFIVVTIAPMFLGGGIRGVAGLNSAPVTLTDPKWEQLGVDVVLSGKVARRK